MNHSSSVLQADSQQTHIVFGNVIGEEVSLVVSMEKGSENSKANREERNEVVRNPFCFVLTHNSHFKTYTSNLAILLV